MKKLELINLINESIAEILKEDNSTDTNYFTFGGYNHPALRNYCVLIKGTPSDARKKMFLIFKSYWAFHYDKKPYENVIDLDKATKLNDEWSKNKLNESIKKLIKEEVIMEMAVPKIDDIVKITVGSFTFPKYYAVIKKVKELELNEYDCNIDIYKLDSHTFVKKDIIEFDYLEKLTKKELKQIGK